MQEFMVHEVEGERLFLLPERALWWPAQKMLIVADVHLGKATHLNKSGHALPNRRAIRDLNFLALLVKELGASRLLILGDLFHSDYNSEFLLLTDFCRHIAPVSVELVMGNHDIAGDNYFTQAGLKLHNDPYCFKPFCFTHNAAVLKTEQPGYVMAGHVHPGIKLYGRAHQSLRLPCFYFGANYALLPAFGSLTGLYTIHSEDENDVIFGIAGEKLVQIPVALRNGA
jgi:uncharacterized protein